MIFYRLYYTRTKTLSMKYIFSLVLRSASPVPGPVSRKSQNGRISDDLILFVSSQRRRLEARNVTVIPGPIPFTT